MARSFLSVGLEALTGVFHAPAKSRFLVFFVSSIKTGKEARKEKGKKISAPSPWAMTEGR